MSIDLHVDRSLAGTPFNNSKRILLADMDNEVLLAGLALWERLKGERKFPSRIDLSARVLKSLLRNTALVRAIDGGRDYEYRIVGDAYVLAHGVSFHGKLWSQLATLSPLYQSYVKPIYDAVVDDGEPIATRGWIERGAGQGQIFSEYLFLPIGELTVDHILVFAAYARREGLEHLAGSSHGSFDR